MRLPLRSSGLPLFSSPVRPSIRIGNLRLIHKEACFDYAMPRITNTMITSTLRNMEELDVVHREQLNEVPPHVKYSLTEKGTALLLVFTELWK
ncbi:MAG: winged helix-turn-helix transcriptional regulator [Christensenellales bacterium]